jgi:uncharacterized membrane protein YuzA (DUF378 family)
MCEAAAADIPGVLAKTFFDFPLWQQAMFGLIAGVFGLFPALVTAVFGPVESWRERAIVILVGAAATGAVLALFVFSKEIQWGGKCAPGC